MKISIITPSYNSAKTISDTIDSVISQTHQDLEYLVIDGVSTDGTIAIVNEYQRKYPIRLVSEKDSGIYDAMNKGIKLTTGDIIGILNSDDFYYDQNVLAKINDVFAANPDVDAVYGDLVYVDQDNTDKQTRYWRSGKYQESKINGGWIIPHPTLFVKREVYNKSEK
ncbi:glycosyl transferase, partial [Candidatus Falkowbacteria bacterium CG23_combo_of_CG06-09_8_20_14_all_41_10]